MTTPSLSLGSTMAFHWRQRLLQETYSRNLTHLHAAIATHVMGLLEAGYDQFSHQEVAEAVRAGVRTVGDALRRLRGLGMLDWTQQFEVRGERRRQIVNRYWLRMPSSSPVPRPDLRRHRPCGVCRPSSKAMNKGVLGAGFAWEDAVAALKKVRQGSEARVAAAWAARLGAANRI